MSKDEQTSKQAQRHNKNVVNKDSSMKSEENHILLAKLRELIPNPLTNERIMEQSRAKRLDGNANDQMQTDESR